MTKKKSGLGRGLDSLFADTGSGIASEQGGEVTFLPLRDIEPDKDQPRKTFDEKALKELSQSIEEHGVLQPIVVRPALAGGYRIVAGERRWRAAMQAELREMPVIVRDVSDEEAMELALIENLQREDLDPIEEALGYKQLMERCNFTQEQAASKLSRSRSAVANSLRLLNLPDDVLALLREGKLSSGHAKAVLSIPQASLQSEAAQIIVAENLNVRKAESVCKKIQQKPKPPKKVMPRPSVAAEVEISLQEMLGTEVKVQYKEGQGTLSVGFYSDAQLKEFARLLGEYEKEKSGV